MRNEKFPFTPRPYQKKILSRTLELLSNGVNPIIELDCGMGKRLLTLWLSEKLLRDKTLSIILIMNSSASLQETAEFMKRYWSKKDDIGILSSRIPSDYRKYLLKTKPLIITLPQTLSNTIKKMGGYLPEERNWVLIINEVDQIIRRLSNKAVLKQPYPLILSSSLGLRIIGMSGTLRDEHYVLDGEQLDIRKDLETLKKMIPSSKVLFMDEVLDDVKPFIQNTIIKLILIEDLWTQKVFEELEKKLSDYKVKASDLGSPIGKGPFGLVPAGYYPESDEEERLLRKISKIYLARKYLYAMPSEKVIRHLYSVLEKDDVKEFWNEMPKIRKKTLSLEFLLENSEFAVILCSYLSSVNEVVDFLSSKGWNTEVITGKTQDRSQRLEKIKTQKGKRAVILSNVGERDIDIPNADTLIIYDLVNTVKTVYQKLKRSRGGKAFILAYSGTSEEDKALRVLAKIKERYNWSVIFEENEYLDF